jgi:hypothetical protein
MSYNKTIGCDQSYRIIYQTKNEENELSEKNESEETLELDFIKTKEIFGSEGLKRLEQLLEKKFTIDKVTFNLRELLIHLKKNSNKTRS